LNLGFVFKTHLVNIGYVYEYWYLIIVVLAIIGCLIMFFRRRSKVKYVKGWSIKEIKRANTANNISVLTQEEKDVVMYMNLARMYPKKYVFVEVIPYDGGILHGHYLKNSPYKDSLIKI
jgi:hypothetical protein